MSFRTALRRRRFELFYGSLILCGFAVGLGQLPAVLDASGPTAVSPIAALLAVGGLGLAATAGWEALHRDRAEWESEQDGGRLLVWLVIGFGALVAGGLGYWLVTAV